MKTSHSFLALALTLGTTAAGCSSADPATNPGDDDEMPAPPTGETPPTKPVEPPKPLDVTGTYAVHSTFDMATNMPGTVGTVVNTVIAATDDGDDPTHWILDQIIGFLPDGTAKSALSFGAAIASEFLNNQLLNIAPDFAVSMLQIGHDFGDLAKHFGLNETLTLTGSGGTYTAVHTVTGVHFKLGNQESDLAFANYHLPNIVVNDVAIAMDTTGQLTIADHKLSIAYGKVLRLGLDAIIIPAIDAEAHNLNELFAHLINCEAIGSGIAGVLHLSFLSSAISGACSGGLDLAAGFIYSKIDAIDGTALAFGLNGTARAQDVDNDRKIDKIQSGAWLGTMTYGATPAALAPATFWAERK